MGIFFGIYWYNIFVNYTKNAEKYNVIWNNANKNLVKFINICAFHNFILRDNKSLKYIMV
jgi:hypothetical protein